LSKFDKWHSILLLVLTRLKMYVTQETAKDVHSFSRSKVVNALVIIVSLSKFFFNCQIFKKRESHFLLPKYTVVDSKIMLYTYVHNLAWLHTVDGFEGKEYNVKWVKS